MDANGARVGRRNSAPAAGRLEVHFKSNCEPLRSSCEHCAWSAVVGIPGCFVVAAKRRGTHLWSGNGVCLLARRVNRLNGFSADNSYRRQTDAVGIIMWNALWIFVGGGLGSLGRWGLSGYVANKFGQTFPGALSSSTSPAASSSVYFPPRPGRRDGGWRQRPFGSSSCLGFAGVTRRFLLSACKRSRSRMMASGSGRERMWWCRRCCVWSGCGWAMRWRWSSTQ